MVIDLKNILIIDIETVSCVADYKQLNERLSKQWDKKASWLHNADTLSSAELFNERAGIYAEFGKIITIAIGFYRIFDDGKIGLRVKVYASHDEKKLLTDFKNLLESKFNHEKLAFCAHNGKEFDYPYLSRRMLVNGISLPRVLDNSNKKPWEINHIDTMELWKFGDRKNFTSLELLAAIFGIESSKENIDGSMVNGVYYNEDNLEKIAKYCMEDVAVTAQLYLKLKDIHTFSVDQIDYLPLEINTNTTLLNGKKE